MLNLGVRFRLSLASLPARMLRKMFHSALCHSISSFLMLGASASTLRMNALDGHLDLVCKPCDQFRVHLRFPHLFTERRGEVFRAKSAKQAVSSGPLARVIIHRENG